MDDAQPFPISRYIYAEGFTYYYPFGNTPPTDFLEHIPAAKPELETDAETRILILGCGDLRSCCYTLWKRLTDCSLGAVDASRNQPIEFVLNDYLSAVLARDLLLAYLVSRFGQIRYDRAREREEFLCAIWAIWFCHELLPTHRSILWEALNTVTDWTTGGRAGFRHSLKKSGAKFEVDFENEDTFMQIRIIWQKWILMMRMGQPTIPEMHKQRDAYLNEFVPTAMRGKKASPPMFAYVPVVDEDLRGISMDKLKQTYEEYQESGSVFAEPALRHCGSTQPDKSNTSANPTFFQQDLYSVHYGTLPFENFWQAPRFLRKSFKLFSVPAQLAYCPVEDSAFKDNHLLANCVQQFALWISGAAVALSSPSSAIRVKFTVALGDCVMVLQRLRHVTSLERRYFDAVYTSNLMDHCSFPNMLTLSTWILKPRGVFIPASSRHQEGSRTFSEYLTQILGMPVEYLPVLLGLECLGYHGRYSSKTYWPYPYGYHIGKFVWKEMCQGTMARSQEHSVVFRCVRQDWDPWILTSLAESGGIGCGSVAEVLAECCQCITMALVDTGWSGIHRNTVASFFLILLRFLSGCKVEKSLLKDAHFWEPLVASIGKKVGRMFGEELQSQAFLHGFHWHLTVDTAECPMCPSSDNSIGDYLQYIEIPVPYEEFFHQVGNYQNFVLIIVLAEDWSLMEMLNLWQFLSSYKPDVSALTPGEYHVTSCLNVDMNHEEVTLGFFCPRKLMTPSMKANFVSLRPMGSWAKVTEFLPMLLTSRSLTDSGVASPSWDQWYFETVEQILDLDNPVSDGVLIRNQFVCQNKEVDFKCTIQSPVTVTKQTIRVKHPNPFQLKVFVDDKCIFLWKFPCFVNRDKLNILIFKSAKQIELSIPRSAHAEVDECRDLFLATAGSRVVFYPLSPKIAREISRTYAGMMFSNDERSVYHRLHPADYSYAMALKHQIAVLLQIEGQVHNLAYNGGPEPGTERAGETTEFGIQCLVAILGRYFDLERRSMVLDMAYCCLTVDILDQVVPKWIRLNEELEAKSGVVKVPGLGLSSTPMHHKNEYDLLKRYLAMCAARTRYPNKPACQPALWKRLKALKISQYFTRAMVYPVFADPDISPEASSKPQCLKCGKASSQRCSRCKQVYYCSPECQKSHWPEHKSFCRA